MVHETREVGLDIDMRIIYKRQRRAFRFIIHTVLYYIYFFINAFSTQGKNTTYIMIMKQNDISVLGVHRLKYIYSGVGTVAAVSAWPLHFLDFKNPRPIYSNRAVRIYLIKHVVD